MLYGKYPYYKNEVLIAALSPSRLVVPPVTRQTVEPGLGVVPFIGTLSLAPSATRHWGTPWIRHGSSQYGDEQRAFPNSCPGCHEGNEQRRRILQFMEQNGMTLSWSDTVDNGRFRSGSSTVVYILNEKCDRTRLFCSSI
jgi:hypothetical protein